MQEKLEKAFDSDFCSKSSHLVTAEPKKLGPTKSLSKMGQVNAKDSEGEGFVVIRKIRSFAFY